MEIGLAIFGAIITAGAFLYNWFATRQANRILGGIQEQVARSEQSTKELIAKEEQLTREQLRKMDESTKEILREIGRTTKDVFDKIS
mgnify:CR=1 FL=1